MARFLMIELDAFQANGYARIKLRLAGTVNRLNVEHWTSNIERWILMTLRFIYFKTSAPQIFPKADKFRRVDSFLAFVANLAK